LEGDFRDRFTLEVGDKYSRIFSQDWKNDILTDRYGEDLFGIADPFLDNIRQAIEPDFVNNYQEQLNKVLK